MRMQASSTLHNPVTLITDAIDHPTNISATAGVGNEMLKAHRQKK